MGLKISDSHELMIKAMNGRSLRQKMISSNIANINTPFYKARDVDFESALTQEANKIHGEKSGQLKMATTHSNHLAPLQENDPEKASVYLRDGHLARNDANTVDLDIETTELGKNAIMFNALTAALKKDSMIFKSVIEASAKTN